MKSLLGVRRRRWIVPEVVQTSAMDCGPAVLKCLLEGYGIRIHYGRLREACQTDLDGTSVDTLESVANRLGLAAEQVMLPPDHVLLPESKSLPAILIVRLPDGATHFVLVWRRHGPLVQVMDPGLGRRWMTARQLVQEMYVHRQRVDADAWRQWASSDEMLLPLRRRIKSLGISGPVAEEVIRHAIEAAHWQPLARLDAALRVVESLVAGGGIRRGHAAAHTLRSLLDQERLETSRPTPDGDATALPDRFWSVRACPQDENSDEADAEQVWLYGAVLVRINGRVDSIPDPQGTGGESTGSGTSESLGVELQAALRAPESKPLSKIVAMILSAGRFTLAMLLMATVIAAFCVVAEALLLRGILDLRRDLATTPQRLFAVAGFVLFGIGLMLLEYRIGIGLYRLGRHLETSLRIEFLSKIPRLHDRYLQSRPISDMAERGHSMHRVRLIPRSIGQLFRAVAAILFTAAAIAWSEPSAAFLAWIAAAIAIVLPIGFLSVLQSLDMRVRTYSGALARFTFDSLQGLAVVRAHVAEKAVAFEHESLLVDWAKSSMQLLRWRVFVDGLQSLIGISLAAWLLMIHASVSTDATGILLLAYWALNLPELGDDIAQLVQQYPTYRNVTLRVLEPLGAPERESDGSLARNTRQHLQHATDFPAHQVDELHHEHKAAVSIRFQGVQVRAGGHDILESLDLHLPAKTHLAIVGPSGAGKSSLVGLLLGWHRAVQGQILIDDQPMDAIGLTRLRSDTVWIDPAVQIWNRSMLDNVLYGNSETGLENLGEITQSADLYDVIERLPEGLQTPLGESGGLLSGGEAQRVKLARGFARKEPRLVILDEPFRGLERHRRHEMLRRARERWQSATLICITHDVSETLDFPRVVVLDHGRLVEDGSPDQLNSRSDSLYRSMLDAENNIRTGLWESNDWRPIQLRAGRASGPDGEQSALP